MVPGKVAIIGCGAAGLTAIKCCLDAGLQPTCFEQQSWLGGVWKYCDEVLPNIIPSVHHSTVTNTSKIMTAFSDFPMPKEFPNYLPQHMLQKYLEMYAKHFCLEQYVRFNTTVVSLVRSDDHITTGRWVISYRKQSKSIECDEILTEIFDGIMVCNGHNCYQARPKIPGMEKFKGIQVHSGDYRTFHPFVGKQVVVVGCGNSGGDVACEVSHHASQVYLSARRGCFIIQRLSAQGKPSDMQLSRAFQKIPYRIKMAMFSKKMLEKYNLANFGLQPTGNLGLTQWPIVNDELPHRIITGSIVVKNDVAEITETAVVFDDGDVVNVDAIIFCTGFKFNFSFTKDIFCVKDDSHVVSLYKHVFLPDVKNSLAVIGAVGVNGPVLPVVEMQARVAAEVFARRCPLPSKDAMVNNIERREQMSKEAGSVGDKLMRVDFVAYLDELAAMIGAKPNLWSLFMEDPKLAFRCFFGTCVSAQYRLEGPNSSKHARTIINSVQENYLFPLKTRECNTSTIKRGNNYSFILYVMGFVFVIFVVFEY